jgi:chromatin segregation and condensation protein Rec8/ScpA/Scc1 (kleisin family)
MNSREKLEELQDARDEALGRMDENPLTPSLVAEYKAAEAKLNEFLSRYDPDSETA